MIAQIPFGTYNLDILIPAKHLPVVKQLRLVEQHSLSEGDIIVFEENMTRSITGVHHAPYVEMNLESANIEAIVTELIENNIEADIQVQPLYEDEKYTNRVDFNVFLRNNNEVVTSYVNHKEQEDTAYELTVLLNELHEKGIHEADEHIIAKINSLHSLGWLY